MRFEKWQALGNDYVILARDELPWELTAERVARICAHHLGVGADGVLLLSPVAGAAVAELRIFNPDGSEAELSGNGAREAALYLRRSGWTDADEFEIATVAGTVRPRITAPGTVAMELGRASLTSPDYPSGPADGIGALVLDGREWRFQHVNVGNPQCVIDAGDEVERLDLRKLGRAVETNELFPNRTNASFVHFDGDEVRARIFERGAGETLASGTGACGAAVAAHLLGAGGPIRVRMDGGELEVAVSDDLDMLLTGTAWPVFAGELAPELVEALSRPATYAAPMATEAETSPRTAPSRRLEAMPPYKFAELERRVSDMRAAGIDVISLGIGDPDRPTFPHIVAAGQAAVADPANQNYPSNRGREEFRSSVSRFYERRFGVDVDPDGETIPAIGAKECIYNLCFAFCDPGDAVLAADPGYPVYTGGPTLAGAEPVLLPLLPELGFAPDLDAIAPEALQRARLMFLNYPNNPTGAIAPDGLFERAVDLAREHDLLVVHDNAYSEITFDGYVAPSFLATPGAREVGVEVFSLSKTFNMTGWRCAALVGNRDAVRTYWRLKTNIDSGLFEAIQVAGAAALDGPREPIDEMNAIYARRRDLVVEALAAIGVEVGPPKGTIYVWAPVPVGDTSASFAERVLEQASVVVSPGSMYGPSGEGWFRISLTTPDERILEALERMKEHM